MSGPVEIVGRDSPEDRFGRGPGRVAVPVVERAFLDALMAPQMTPMALTAPDLRLIEVNSTMARMVLGSESEYARGRSVGEFFAPDFCDYSRRLHASLFEDGIGQTLVSMLRGVFTRSRTFPVELRGEGRCVLHVVQFGEVIGESRLRKSRVEQGVVEWSPVVDAGPLGGLTRTEVSYLRGLASGYSPEELARIMRVSPVGVASVLEGIDGKLGWGGLRGLVSHAYASGLHLYDEGYFQTVVLEALEPD